MSSICLRIAKHFKLQVPTRNPSSFVRGLQGSLNLYSTASSSGSDNDVDGGDVMSNEMEDLDDDFLPKKPELQMHTVDPRRGWGFRGVHKAILCGKIGQAPVLKILRNGRTVTIFTVGTGGMYDQRTLIDKDSPKPAQWHRVAVHNDFLGTYAVQQLVKNSSVYVEGDIETRVYNDSIDGAVRNIPEICVRHDGRIRVIKAEESIRNITMEELDAGVNG